MGSYRKKKRSRARADRADGRGAEGTRHCSPVPVRVPLLPCAVPVRVPLFSLCCARARATVFPVLCPCHCIVIRLELRVPYTVMALELRVPYTVTACIVMARIAMASVVMAFLVMACMVMDGLYGYGLYSYGLYSYGLCSDGLYSYGLR